MKPFGKSFMGPPLRAAAAWVMMFSFLVILRCFVGLGFKLAEEVIGERDYSQLFVVRAAEIPTETLLTQLALSTLVFGFLIIAGVLEDGTARSRHQRTPGAETGRKDAG